MVNVEVLMREFPNILSAGLGMAGAYYIYNQYIREKKPVETKFDLALAGLGIGSVALIGSTMVTDPYWSRLLYNIGFASAAAGVGLTALKFLEEQFKTEIITMEEEIVPLKPVEEKKKKILIVR